MKTRPCSLCNSSLELPQLINKALRSRYEAITNIHYLNRVERSVEGNHVVLLEDLIEFNSQRETLTLCFGFKIGRSTFQKQIDFLKHHTDYPKLNANIGASELIRKYKAKKRMLKFIHLSNILNIQLDNDAFSISSMILEMQGKRDKEAWNQQLAELVKEKEQKRNWKERSTIEQTFKRTVKKTRSKQKSKEKNKIENKKFRSLSKPKKR